MWIKIKNGKKCTKNNDNNWIVQRTACVYCVFLNSYTKTHKVLIWDDRFLKIKYIYIYISLPSTMEWVGLEAGKTFDITKEVDKSRGLSSRTLSISLLNKVVLKYWMAGSKKASSGLSGTKKATSSVLGPTSLMRSKIGSPVGPLVPIRLTSSL